MVVVYNVGVWAVDLEIVLSFGQNISGVYADFL